MGLSELNNVSLAVTYDLDNTFDESRFIKMRLRVFNLRIIGGLHKNET